MQEPLVDGYGRKHDYLRLSLTDACDLRCTYCMPEMVQFMKQAKLMNREEILDIAGIFVKSFGINKIRLTGGEPLLRPDAGEIIQGLSRLPVKLAITTNGTRLHAFLPILKEAGIGSLNISLDSLRRDRFEQITLRDNFEQVWENIQKAKKAGFRIKLNVVVMKGMNDDEILDFVRLGMDESCHIRFIEFMPFNGNNWQWEKVLGYRQILEKVEREYRVHKLADSPNSTSKAYQVDGFAGTFSMISTITDHFCGDCNRIRLTADGKLRNCLFATKEWDLLSAYRNGEPIIPIIEASVKAKAMKLGGLPAFQDQDSVLQKLDQRSMVKIGG